MPSIAVVGAAGRTGRILVPLAIAAGHPVRALARRPEATGLPAGPQVVRADARDPGSLHHAVAGVDVVVSLLGVSRLVDARRVEGLFSRGTGNLRAAMASAGVRRLVAVSSLGVVGSPGDPWLYRAMKRSLLRSMYADMRVMEHEALADEHLQVTVVRAARLTGRPVRRDPRRPVADQPPGRRSVSREELAAWLLDEVETGAHAGRIVPLPG